MDLDLLFGKFIHPEEISFQLIEAVRHNPLRFEIIQNHLCHQSRNNALGISNEAPLACVFRERFPQADANRLFGHEMMANPIRRRVWQPKARTNVTLVGVLYYLNLDSI